MLALSNFAGLGPMFERKLAALEIEPAMFNSSPPSGTSPSGGSSSATLRDASVRGAFWSLVQQLVGRGLSFVVFAILARLLTPNDFGLVALVTGFLALLEMFVDQGFSVVIVQREHLDDEHLDSVFWINLALGVVLAGIFILAGPLVARAFDAPEIAPLIPWMATTLIVRGASGVHEGLLRRELQYRALAIRSLLASCIGGLAGIVAAARGLGVWSLIIYQLVSGGIGLLTLWQASPWRPRLRIARSKVVEILRFSIYLLGGGLLEFMSRRSDDFLIGYSLGPSPLGVYSVPYRLFSVLVQFFVKSLSGVALSTLSRLERTHERLVAALGKTVKLTSGLTLPIFGGVAVMSRDIVITCFGSKWTASVPVLQVLAILGMLYSVTYYLNSLYIVVGRPDIQLKLLSVHTIANIVGFVIAVRWGIVAVAAAYSIRAYVLLPLDILVLHRLVGLRARDLFRHVGPPAASTLLMCVVTVGVNLMVPDLSPPMRLALASLVGLASYVLALRLLAPALLNELTGLVRTTLKRMSPAARRS